MGQRTADSGQRTAGRQDTLYKARREGGQGVGRELWAAGVAGGGGTGAVRQA